MTIMTAEGWLKQPKYKGITIVDPDGWDRQNFEASWKEKITRMEFEKRMLNSTCLFKSSALSRMGINL